MSAAARALSACAYSRGFNGFGDARGMRVVARRRDLGAPRCRIVGGGQGRRLQLGHGQERVRKFGWRNLMRRDHHALTDPW